MLDIARYRFIMFFNSDCSNLIKLTSIDKDNEMYFHAIVGTKFNNCMKQFT